MEDKEESSGYNRLILIGNGFDLALGLKTSYSDFILDYMKTVVFECYKNGGFETELIELKSKKGKVNNIGDVGVYMEGVVDLQKLLKDISNEISVTYKFDFFRDIVTTLSNVRWVDIESEYYTQLLHDFNVQVANGFKNRDYSSIMQLNQCMNAITKALYSYIREQQEQAIIDTNKSSMFSVMEKMFEPLSKKEFSLTRNGQDIKSPEDILFLNFNYTSTITKFLGNSFVRSKYEGGISQIHIHGSIGNANNPIIFGYGDDTGDEYHELEKDGDDELLKKIKSFQYPKTYNYHNLLNFTEGGEYEVFILGHSCGLSDKTMLKSIFENSNCIAIKNFHYLGEKEDFQKRMAISRHFIDKARMRKLVLPFDEHAKIHQTNNKGAE